MADTPAALVSREGNVGVVELNRPERRNALDEDLVTGIATAFDELEADPAITVVVVIGAGTAFCAGAVLDTLVRSADGGFDEVKAVYDGFLRVRRSPLPTIAAVNGPAIGAGLNLALACDVRIASTAARFESRFPQLRLAPGGGHSWLLEQAVGRQLATLMSVFGRAMDAETALAAGLVAEVVAPEDLREAAATLGAAVEGIEREWLTTVVSTLRDAEEEPTHAAVLALETERQRWSTTRPDFVARTRALQQRISSRS
jgi:enoyl-CoA hydratase